MFASFQRGQCLKPLALLGVMAWLPRSASAQTCPFDNGGSDATNAPDNRCGGEPFG